MTHHPHDHGHAVEVLGFAVLTVSDTRTPGTDESGRIACEIVEAAGHRVAAYRIVADEAPRIRADADAVLMRDDVDVLVLTGGTGVGPRDVTPEAVEPIMDRVLPGVGELFRALSFEEVGARALASRALGGVSRGKPVFALPGSPAGLRLGLERLILPEAAHLRDLAGE